MNESNYDIFTYLYYHLRPFIPRNVQIILRRKIVRSKRAACADIWPIDERAGERPVDWSGWPEGKKFALVLTHDLDTDHGQKKCRNLINMEQDLGFRASYNFVPERYKVSSRLRRYIEDCGLEVGVHDLKHDGKLYKSEEYFMKQAGKINRYLNEWDCIGFRAGSMICNLEWMHELNIKYDSSTFDTDPFEPQPEGVKTIFPFWVSNNAKGGYIELPYTLAQDFTLFILMKEETIDVWKRKLDWIVEKGGMALINTHPDYMSFNGIKSGMDSYPARYYKEFLEYIKTRYEGQYWHVLPRDMAKFWRNNHV